MKRLIRFSDSASSRLTLRVGALLLSLVTLLLLPASAMAAPVYRLQVALPPTLTVGEELQPWEAQVRILRPSPGDNFWYRLPHTVQVTGDLPPGIRLAQQGANFFELPSFVGSPTQAGQFTVQVQATMSDGLTTVRESVTFFVSDPRNESYTVQTWGLTRLRQGLQVGNAGAFLVSQTQSLLRAAVQVQATGLPSGLTIGTSGSPGYYSIQGAPETAGQFNVKLVFTWPDGSPIAETTADLEVLPADYQANQILSVVVPGDIRKNVAYLPFGYRAPFLYVEDEFGDRSSEQLTLAATGLPPGLTVNTEHPGNGFLVGRPVEEGTFDTTFKATLPDGTITNEVKVSIVVLPAVPFANISGTYDSVVQRSEELNDNNGGRLRFTITRSGQTSGFLIHKLVRYPFASPAVTLDLDTGEIVINPPRAGVTVRGQIALDDEFSASNSQPYITFNGNLENGNNSTPVDGARVTVRSAADPSPYTSEQRINLVFVNEDTSGTNQPAGAGFLAASISPVGNVTLTVWAPDGSAPVSLATTLSETSYGATFPVYFIIPNSSGASTLIGQVFINAEGDAAGELTWYQSATNRGGFPEGIPLVSYAGVIGSRHVPEPAGLNILGLEESILNAQLDLIGEDVPADAEVSLTVQRNSMMALASSKVSGVKLNFDRKTGLLTGSMTMPATKTSRARAVIFRGIRTPNGAGMIGHFSAPSAKKPSVRSTGMLKVSAR